MIKTAQDAYLAGRQAAMEKLADGAIQEWFRNTVADIQKAGVVNYLEDHVLSPQMDVLNRIGVGGEGLYNTAKGNSFTSRYLDPRRLATMQNLSRLGMLGGAVGGTYLGGRDPRAAAISAAGALGGGIAGGNLGMALGAVIPEFTNRSLSKETLNDIISAGGAIGGLGGGLAAGKYFS